MSSLERGLKSPTLEKIQSLASRMNIHPLTLVTLTYLCDANDTDTTNLLVQVKSEVDRVLG